MNWTPVLHFSGRFRFQMPEYNNDPTGKGVSFDPSLAADDVKKICGCDPSKYFEFSFFDVSVRQVTYGDSSVATSGDAMIGVPLALDGFMVDVSPTAICAQIFCTRFRLGGLMQGALSKGIQSDLRLNIRPLGFGDESAAAYFDSVLTSASPLSVLPSSRAREELGSAQTFDIHFHLNRYTRVDNNQEPLNHLTGDVYGYLRPTALVAKNVRKRTNNIRLVAHPEIGRANDIETTYLTDIGKTPFMRMTDIDGYYDIDPLNRIACLRYLDFIPFLDRNRTTPRIKEYAVLWEAETGRTDLARFRGDVQEMQQTGGLAVFKVPDGLPDGRLAVDVVRVDGSSARLMLESEWDIVLEDDRGLYLASAKSVSIDARVFRANRPVSGHLVELITEASNRRSPIVARLTANQVASDAEGRVTVTVQALDFKATGGVEDPVTGTTLNTIPLDRFCGNFVYLRIVNPMRRTSPPVEEIQVAVRVLHTVESGLASASFAGDIKPLFSMYLRYFPWIHVVPQGLGYARFLNLEDAEEVRGNATEIVNRLGKTDTDPKKMPRSRDFPIGGRELIQKWIDSGMAD